MQLVKKLALPLTVIATTSSPTILYAISTDSISFTQMHYEENDDRIGVDFNVWDIKKDFGTDYSLGVNLSYDAISGGTPVWDSLTGGSTVAESDVISGASPCISNDEYICKDTYENDQLIGNGGATPGDYVYRNVEIKDTRKAISTSFTIRTASRDEISLGAAYSVEEDFASKEVSVGYLYNMDRSRNNTIAVGVSYQANDAYHYREDIWKDFNIVNFQIGYTHTVSKKTVAQLNFFTIRQNGELSNPYQTIIRKVEVSKEGDPTYSKFYLAKEKRPDVKSSSGITADISSKVLDNVALHGYYRLYNDNWGVVSHTVTMNAYIDMGNKWTLAPLVRYYKQTGSDFYKDHKTSDNIFNETDYGSADERLSEFDSITYSLGLEKEIKKGIKVKGAYVNSYQSFDLQMNWLYAGVKIDL